MSELDPELAEAYAQLWDMYQTDWVFYVEHALGHCTWSKQREIIYSVQHNPRTAVRACHGSSKTFTAGEIVAAHYNLNDEGMVITTAPRFQQVEALLWSEINKIYRTSRAELLGRILKVRIDDAANPRHFALGFSTDTPANAEGWHAWDLLFVFDEAKGIAQWMWDAARGACTGGNSRWLAISTTDGVEIGSEYWKCFQQGSDWNQIAISAHDSPFVTGEKFRKLIVNPDNPFDFDYEYITPEEMKIQLADRDYIEKNKDPIIGFGEGTVLYNTKVLGQICDQGADCVIKISSVNRMYDNFRDQAFSDSGKKIAGIDCAFGGTDNTVVFKRKGMKIAGEPLVIITGDLPQESIIKYQCDQIEKYLDFDVLGYEVRIDADGGGIAIVSEMQSRGWNVVPVHNGGTSQEPDKYGNVISEIWYKTRDSLHLFACPEINRLTRELTQRKWYGVTGMDKAGHMLVEEKPVYMARGYPSPDFADAFLYCVADLAPGAYFSVGKEVY